MNETKTPQNRRVVMIAAAVVAAVVVIGLSVGIGVMAGRSTGRAEAEAEVAARPSLGEDGRIGYASTGVVATDPETLQDQVDAMLEKANEPGIALEYKNMMVSDDGVNFACFLGNSEDNPYDMYFAIYGDQSLTEEWYLSELLRPGTRFEQVTFQKKLDPGNYTGYLVHTQVKDEQQAEGTYQQVIQAQIATTISVVVNDY